MPPPAPPPPVDPAHSLSRLTRPVDPAHSLGHLTGPVDPALSLGQLTVPDVPLPTTARLARRSGFRGIGVHPTTLDRLGVAGVRTVLETEELRPTSVCALTNLIHLEPASGRAEQCLAYAAELDVPLVVLVGGVRAGLGRREAWRRAVDAFATLARQAADRGVRLLLEPLHPVQMDMSVVTTLTDGLALIGSAGDAGLVVDTWHVWWDPRLPACLREAGQRVGIVHLSDWAAEPSAHLDRVLPGEGVADLPSICAELLDAGFTGWWEVEILSRTLRAADPAELIPACHRAAVAVLERARRRVAPLGS